MKKFIITSFMALFLGQNVLAADSPIIADSSSNVRNSRDHGINTVAVMADPANGYCQNIDSVGNAYVTDAYSGVGFTWATVLSDAVPSLGADCLIDTGEGIVKDITFYSNTADDYVIGYDNTTNSGTILFDIQGAENQTIHVPLNMNYATGLTVVQSAEGNNAGVVWKSID